MTEKQKAALYWIWTLAAGWIIGFVAGVNWPK